MSETKKPSWCLCQTMAERLVRDNGDCRHDNMQALHDDNDELRARIKKLEEITDRQAWRMSLKGMYPEGTGNGGPL